MEGQLQLAFFAMSGLTMLVAALSAFNATNLSRDIQELGKNRLPSVDGLWKINEGQTQIQSAQYAILTPGGSVSERQQLLRRIDAAWKQINSGIQQYEATPSTAEESRRYAEFKQRWSTWETDHKQLLKAVSTVGGQPFPAENTPRGRQIFSLARQESGSFDAATAGIIKVIEINYELGTKAAEQGESAARSAMFWSFVSLLAAPAIGFFASRYFTRTIAQPLGARIASVVDVAAAVADGNLTRNVPPNEDADELGRLQNSIHTMVTSLAGLVQKIQSSGVQITTSATQIAASGRQLEATMNEQMASTNEVTATAQQIAATARTVVQSMEAVQTEADATAQAASSSQQDLNVMETLMRDLATATRTITAKLDVMHEKASNINTVVTTITKVADQTNLLSLNAAIEAEKAGEYGTGFAVVAREIRRLADQTAVATLEIEQMVKEMQGAVSTGVMEMEQFSKTVGHAVNDVVRITDQVEGMIGRVQGLTPRFEMVGRSLEEQAEGALQISQAMQQLSDASQQTSEALRDSNQAVEELNGCTRTLRQEVSRFHVA